MRLTTFEIAEMFEVERETLADWMKRGFIAPTIAADGKGTKAYFIGKDIARIPVFMLLLKIGFTRKAATKMMKGGETERKTWAEDSQDYTP